MKLSILILSLDCRRHFIARLLALLDPQRTDDVEILVNLDDGEKTVGQKRNELLIASTGGYVCFVDDDDIVAETYVAEIQAALGTSPDCVGFKVKRYVDNFDNGEAIHSLRYSDWRHIDNRDFTCLYERCPNHLNPVKRELALATMFNASLNCGEDYDYSMRLRPLLKSEAFIDKHLYSYYYVMRASRKHERINHASPH